MTATDLEHYIGLFHKAVYRLALSIVHNEAEAEDVCQNAFCKLLDYGGEFEAPENCKAWLFRVTVNLSKNILKSTRFSRTAQLGELDENIPAVHNFNEEESALWETVTKLAPKYRAAIHLLHLDGRHVGK